MQTQLLSGHKTVWVMVRPDCPSDKLTGCVSLWSDILILTWRFDGSVNPALNVSADGWPWKAQVFWPQVRWRPGISYGRWGEGSVIGCTMYSYYTGDNTPYTSSGVYYASDTTLRNYTFHSKRKYDLIGSYGPYYGIHRIYSYRH